MNTVRQSLSWLAVWLGLASALTCRAEAPLKADLGTARGSVRYLVGMSGMVIGRTSHVWQRDGDSYKLVSTTETTGLAALFKRAKLVQVSEGKIDATGLVPSHFRVFRDGSAEASESADFDWRAGRINWGGSGNQQQADLPLGSQDWLSLIWQLAFRPPSANSEFAVATGKGYAHHTLSRLADDKIATPLGELATRHYRSAGERSTDIWLASDYRLVPVRVRFVEKNGDAIDMVADAIDFGPVQLNSAPAKAR